MRIKTKEFKSAAKTILYALDSKDKNLFSETLELKTEGNILHLNVTNRAYYVSVKFNLGYEDNFHATVNAQLFLNLISKLTTDEIELTATDRVIKINANGEYKLPMIYHDNSLLELPKIEIGNQTGSMNINSDILISINLFNSKELIRGVIAKPVQNYYYIDEFGAITFTSGACVNNFSLEQPIKILLDDKVVKLFKLFKQDENVEFAIGQDAVSDTITQTKVKFSTPIVEITAILPDSGLISSVPVSAIRGMATNTYAHSVVIESDLLVDALNRILLFNDANTYGFFEFTRDTLTIFDYSRENKETLTLMNECPTLDSYTLATDLANFKLILEGIEDEYITINFGNHKAIVVKKNSVTNVIPEIRL